MLPARLSPLQPLGLGHTLTLTLTLASRFRREQGTHGQGKAGEGSGDQHNLGGRELTPRGETPAAPPLPPKTLWKLRGPRSSQSRHGGPACPHLENLKMHSSPRRATWGSAALCCVCHGCLAPGGLVEGGTHPSSPRLAEQASGRSSWQKGQPVQGAEAGQQEANGFAGAWGSCWQWGWVAPARAHLLALPVAREGWGGSPGTPVRVLGRARVGWPGGLGKDKDIGFAPQPVGSPGPLGERLPVSSRPLAEDLIRRSVMQDSTFKIGQAVLIGAQSRGGGCRGPTSRRQGQRALGLAWERRVEGVGSRDPVPAAPAPACSAPKDSAVAARQPKPGVQCLPSASLRA